MSRIKFSIIIVSYRNKILLDNCIQSIIKYNDAPNETEIIIIDNSPDDEVYEYIKEKFSEVIIKKSENYGFGAGNNYGVKLSKGDYLLFLNPDTVLLEPIFKFAIEKFETDEKVAIFGMKLLNRYKKRTYSYFFMDKFDVFSAIIEKVLNRFDIFLPKLMYIHGANFFVRKECFVNAGMFDEEIFMYLEEPDITRRIKNQYPNAKICYFPEKKIVHLEGSSSPGLEGQINSIKRLMVTERHYCKKYGIDFHKRVKKRRQYIFLKKTISRFVDKKMYEEQKKIYEIYSSYL